MLSNHASTEFTTFRDGRKLACCGTLAHASRQSAVFELHCPAVGVQAGESLDRFRIQRGERAFYEGRAVASGVIDAGHRSIVSVTLLDPWSVPAETCDGRLECAGFVTGWRQASDLIDGEFRAQISRIVHFLEELNRWLSLSEADLGVSSADAAAPPSQAMRRLAADVFAAVGPHLDALFAEFERLSGLAACDRRPAHAAFARRQLHPLIMCSPFMHRTFSKPLGYAGDFEMVNMILRDPVEGGSTYARVLNMCILSKAPAQAHRNRIDHLVGDLEAQLRARPDPGRPLRVLNVACGPAAEVQRLLERNPETPQLFLELLDFSEETLQWTSEAIAVRQAGQRIPAQVGYIHKSIHTLLKESVQRDAPEAPRYDFVYCAGLFDYLSDKICERLLALFTAWTLPGGRILATNVNASNPIRNFMEHLLDWHLVYRDEAGLARLAPSGVAHRVFADDTGVNLFLELSRPAAPSGPRTGT